VQGNKVGVTIIYTPATNILKRGDFATGAVTFHDARKVRRFRIEERENAIVNRLKCVCSASLSRRLREADGDITVSSKTKREVKVDHEAERIARDSARQRAKRLAATEARNAELATVRARKAEIEARSYDRIHGDKGTDTWEEDQWEASRKEGDVRSLLSAFSRWSSPADERSLSCAVRSE